VTQAGQRPARGDHTRRSPSGAPRPVPTRPGGQHQAPRSRRATAKLPVSSLFSTVGTAASVAWRTEHWRPSHPAEAASLCPSAARKTTAERVDIHPEAWTTGEDGPVPSTGISPGAAELQLAGATSRASPACRKVPGAASSCAESDPRRPRGPSLSRRSRETVHRVQGIAAAARWRAGSSRQTPPSHPGRSTQCWRAASVIRGSPLCSLTVRDNCSA